MVLVAASLLLLAGSAMCHQGEIDHSTWYMIQRPQVIRLPIAITSIPGNVVDLYYYAFSPKRLQGPYTVTVNDLRPPHAWGGNNEETHQGPFTLIYSDSSDPDDPYTLVYTTFSCDDWDNGSNLPSLMNDVNSRGVMYYDISYVHTYTDSKYLEVSEKLRYTTGTFNVAFSNDAYFTMNSYKTTYHIDDTRSGKVPVIFPTGGFDAGLYARMLVSPFKTYMNQVFETDMKMNELVYNQKDLSSSSYYLIIKFNVLQPEFYETYMTLHNGPSGTASIVYYSPGNPYYNNTDEELVLQPIPLNAVLENSNGIPSEVTGQTQNPPSLHMLFRSELTCLSDNPDCVNNGVNLTFDTKLIIRKEFVSTPFYSASLFGTDLATVVFRPFTSDKALTSYLGSDDSVPVYPLGADIAIESYYLADIAHFKSFFDEPILTETEDSSVQGYLRVFPAVCLFDTNLPSPGCALTIEKNGDSYHVSMEGNGFFLEQQYYDLPVTNSLKYLDADEDVAPLNIPKIVIGLNEDNFELEQAERNVRLVFYTLGKDGNTIFMGGSSSFAFSLRESGTWVWALYAILLLVVIAIIFCIAFFGKKLINKAIVVEGASEASAKSD